MKTISTVAAQPIAICIFGRMRNAMQFPCVFLPLVAMLHRCSSKKVLESSAISEQWRTKALHHKALKDPMCRWRYPFFVFVCTKNKFFFFFIFRSEVGSEKGELLAWGLDCYTHTHTHTTVYTHTPGRNRGDRSARRDDDSVVRSTWRPSYAIAVEKNASFSSTSASSRPSKDSA